MIHDGEYRASKETELAPASCVLVSPSDETPSVDILSNATHTTTPSPAGQQQSPPSSNKHFYHMDAQSKRMDREAELEALRNKGLARNLRKDLDQYSDAFVVTGDGFFVEQQQLQKKLKEQQQASIDDLHKYRGQNVLSMNKVQRKTQTEQTIPPRASTLTTAGLSEMDQFILQQRQISKEWKKQQHDSASYLHSYRGTAASSEELCSIVTPTNFDSTIESVLEASVSDITQTVERNNTMTTVIPTPSPNSPQGERIIAVVANAQIPSDADESSVNVSIPHNDDISPNNLMKTSKENSQVIWIPPEINSNGFPVIVSPECPSELQDSTETFDMAIPLPDTAFIDNEGPLFLETHISNMECIQEEGLNKGEESLELTQIHDPDNVTSENLHAPTRQRCAPLQDLECNIGNSETRPFAEKSGKLESPAIVAVINSVVGTDEESSKVDIKPSGIDTKSTCQTPTEEWESTIYEVNSDNITVNITHREESTTVREISGTIETPDLFKVDTEYLTNIHKEQSKMFVSGYSCDGANGLFVLKSSTENESSDQVVAEASAPRRLDAAIVTPPQFENSTGYHHHESMPIIKIQVRNSCILALKDTSLNDEAVDQRTMNVHIPCFKDDTNVDGGSEYNDCCKSVVTESAIRLTHHDEKEPKITNNFDTSESHMTLSTSSPLSTPCTKRSKFTAPSMCGMAKESQNVGSPAKRFTRSISTSTPSSHCSLRTPVSEKRSLTKSETSLQRSSCKQSPRKVVPLYKRTSFHPSMNINDPICCQKWVPDLHPSRAGCERCLFHASSKEKLKFETEGRHFMIFLTKGGCSRDCNNFPRTNDEQPARLCRKCFHDTHRFGMV